MISMLVFVESAFGQSVAINNSGAAPHASAMLDVSSNNKGMLMPRTSTVSRMAMINPAKGLAVYDTTAGSFYFYTGADWELLSNGKNLWSQNGFKTYSTASSFVGFGTDDPQNPVHVHNSLYGYIKFTNNSTGQGATDGSFVGAFSKDLYLYNRESDGDMYFYTKNLQRMAIDSMGRVGIGKMPVEQLDVKGDVRFESTNNTTGSILRMYGGATGISAMYFYKDIVSPILGASLSYSASSDYFSIVNGTGMYITNTGVGLSTSIPVSKLHIATGGDAGLSNTSNGFLTLGSVSSSNLIFDNNEIMARNNGVAAPLTFQNDGGSVRIGNVAAPVGYLFAVNGKMISEELKVQLSGNWPDYVFKEDYNLKSLDDLRQYIKTNHHLPNIPPAAEVEKNGMEVGDMQKRMMEKIEELTLYILELETRIKNIEKKSSIQ